MENQKLEAAAQFLANARRAGIPGPRLPDDLRPADVESALAVQRRVAELLGQVIGGWKCALPSAERPINAARIFASTIRASSPFPVVATGNIARIEPEVAFVMGGDLPQRATPYTEAEIRAAVSESRLVLEILGTRYADPGAASWSEMVADSVQNQGLFLGPEFSRGFDASLHSFAITIRTASGVLSTHDGRHGDGHPLNPLYWLANFLADRGEGLREGQVVTTGSYAGAIEVPIGQRLTVTYGDLGDVEIEMQRAQ
jgi:2-keto-4-pentenoate hydratase